MISRRRFLESSAGLAAAAPLLLRAAGRPVVSIGLIADAQYADLAAVNTRYYRDSIDKLTEAVAHFNGLELDFCLSLGDLIDQRWESFGEILKPLDRSKHKFYHVLGNHDFTVPDEFKSLMPGRLGLKQRYYSMLRGNLCLVMLDTTDVSLFAHPENSTEWAAAKAVLQRLTAAGAANAQSWNGAVGGPQLEWFEATCRKAASNGQKVVVFSHNPIFPADAHVTWNSDQLLEAVKRHRNVVAWFSGHNHAGAYGVHDEVPFVTLKGMVETKDTNAFAEAHMHSDHIELVGHGREVSRKLVFRTV
ncbi:MAG: metallophosphoesterase, partial [Verrucomicrobia bacterium]|nr:metallophosphoesterase [Verrucomicrobiota bacterium]